MSHSIAKVSSVCCFSLITSILSAQSLPFTTQSGYPGSANVSASVGSSDLSGFTTSVTNAFSANSGGTLTFDTGTFTPNSGSSYFASSMPILFGVAQSYRMNLTPSVIMQGITSSGSFTPLNSLGTTTSSDRSTYSFSFGNISDIGTSTDINGAGVIELGFTVLSRTNASYPLDIRATVTFSDTSTASLSDSIGNVQGDDNTFYQFTATGGKTITSLTLAAFETGTSTPVATRIGLDNIGFVTNVPEPSTYALLVGFGVLGIAFARQKRRS